LLTALFAWAQLQLHDFQGAVLRLDAELEKQAKAKAQTAPDGPVVIEVCSLFMHFARVLTGTTHRRMRDWLPCTVRLRMRRRPTLRLTCTRVSGCLIVFSCSPSLMGSCSHEHSAALEHAGLSTAAHIVSPAVPMHLPPLALISHCACRGLSPRRKPLLAKVAHRCRSCEKILVKPKTGANVVAFDVHHWALYASGFSSLPV
jgi:hypothetical protein